MAEGFQERARLLLATSTLTFRLWALARVTDLIARVAARTPEPRRQAAQRFGTQLWKRITSRFPALEGLIEGPPQPVATVHVQQVARPTDAQKTSDVSALLRALRDPSAEVAAAAASALSTQSDPSMDEECRQALFDVLKNTEGFFNPITRVAALQALLPRLVPTGGTLMDAVILLVHDVDAEVSMAAISAIAQRASATEALNTLLPVVHDDTGFYLPMVQTAAANALERAGLLPKPHIVGAWSSQH